MLREQFLEYDAAIQAADADHRRNLEPGYCPALVAENLQMEAEHALIGCAEQFFPNVTVDSLLCGTRTMNGLDALKKYLELLIGLVVNAPGYRAPRIPSAKSA
jgi:hypothetical protein